MARVERLSALLGVTALFGVAALLLVACASPSTEAPSTPTPSTPTGAATVHVRVVDDTVILAPPTVPAGSVQFVIDEPPDGAGHAGMAFMARGLGPCPPCTEPDPLLEGDIERLRADSAPQGIGSDGGWGAGITLTLSPGTYAFMVAGPQGALPGVPPISVTPLVVTP